MRCFNDQNLILLLLISGYSELQSKLDPKDIGSGERLTENLQESSSKSGSGFASSKC